MAQSIKYPTSANFVQKTLGAQLLAGATASATLNNVTSIQNKPGVMIIDRVDTNNVETPTKREVIVFTATSGVTVTGLTRNADGSGTDQDHAVGAIVEFGPDVMWAQSLIDGISQVVDTSTGLVDLTKITDLSSAQTLTNKTLTSPNIVVGSDAAGDLYYKGAGASLLCLPIGAVPSLLLANASLPYWGFISGASGSILTSTGNSAPPVMSAAPSPATTGTNSESVLSSDFSITGADGVFQDTGLSISLPSSGTYLLYGTASARFQFSAGGDAYCVIKLYNSTDSADVTNSERVILFAGAANVQYRGSAPLTQIVTVAASKTIKLYASRNDGTTYTTSNIISGTTGRTNLGYVKLA